MRHLDLQNENIVMIEVKRLYFSKLTLLTTRKQSIVCFLSLFPLKSSYFSRVFKTTRRIAQAELIHALQKHNSVLKTKFQGI